MSILMTYGFLRSRGRRYLPALMLVGGLALGGCDLTVDNPGPVADDFLNDELAQPALVNSIGYAFLSAFNQVTYTQMVVTRETHFAGQTGAHGFPFAAHLGELNPEDMNVHWNNSHQARWIAEDAVERMRTLMGPAFSSSQNVGRALLWQGYVYRLMGENWCHTVLDGGAPESNEVLFTRAESALTEAMSVAQSSGDMEGHRAARAARASIRAFQGDWTGAVSDAREIPTDFVFSIRTSGLADDQHNRVYWGSSNNPWRAHSVWNTFYEDYFTETGDPRASWGSDPAVPWGNSQVTGIGNVPWYFQTKYTAQDSPYPLSKGTEMRLIEAEALLRSGDWQGAMTLINEVRTRNVSVLDGTSLSAWTADNLEEAWTHLKRERGIELWLEGRRLGDLRRWVTDGSPGAMADMTGRSLCFPIPDAERERNPNVPVDFPGAPTG